MTTSRNVNAYRRFYNWPRALQSRRIGNLRLFFKFHNFYWDDTFKWSAGQISLFVIVYNCTLYKTKRVSKHFYTLFEFASGIWASVWRHQMYFVFNEITIMLKTATTANYHVSALTW